MKKINLLLISIICLILIIQCKKENIDNINTGFKHGVFISNEGAFGGGNASISYFNPDSVKLINNLFGTINGRPLGDQIQSFRAIGNKGFLVVNGSKKIEVVDLESFYSIGVIENLSYPRFIIEAGTDQAYISNGNMGGMVYVINLESLIITDSIVVGNGPDKMVKTGNKVYVANSGGWLNDNSVSVIDISSNEVINTIEVGDRPTDMVIDAENNVWVLCRGKQVYDASWTEIIEETDSKLVIINSEDDTIKKSLIIGQKGDMNPYIRFISVINEGETILFDESEGIYSIGINDNAVPSQALINKSVYGMEADPENNIIYCFEVKDFVSDGLMFRYDKNGLLLDSLKVGIGPNGAYFN